MSTSIYTTSNPIFSSFLHGSRTAGCSIFVVMICLPSLFLASATPKSAKLSLSVPPDVKKISLSLKPIDFAISPLTSFILFCTVLPSSCSDDGFPKSFSKDLIITSVTSFDCLVVELLSKYIIFPHITTCPTPKDAGQLKFSILRSLSP